MTKETGDIEVTPEMIEAGVDVLEGMCESDSNMNYEKASERIFRAMLLVANVDERCVGPFLGEPQGNVTDSL